MEPEQLECVLILYGKTIYDITAGGRLETDYILLVATAVIVVVVVNCVLYITLSVFSIIQTKMR